MTNSIMVSSPTKYYFKQFQICHKDTRGGSQHLPTQQKDNETSTKPQTAPLKGSPTSSLGRVNPSTEYAWQRKMSCERGLNQKAKSSLKLGSRLLRFQTT